MTESIKREMIGKYLLPLPIGLVLLASGGLGLLIAGLLCSSKGMIVIGLLGAGFGIYACVAFRRGKPSDEQMDAWLEEDLRYLNLRGLEKMGVDQQNLVNEAAFVVGPKLWGVGGARVAFKIGRDGVIRYSPIVISVFNFTSNQLLTYNVVFDFTLGVILNESTDEYFYRDVVSVTTKLENQTVFIKRLGFVRLSSADTFSLTTSAGTSISVFLTDPTLVQKMGGGIIRTDRAEKALASVRKVLRERKHD